MGRRYVGTCHSGQAELEGGHTALLRWMRARQVSRGVLGALACGVCGQGRLCCARVCVGLRMGSLTNERRLPRVGKPSWANGIGIGMSGGTGVRKLNG